MITAKKMKSDERINSFVTNSGNRFKKEFVGEVQEDGSIFLRETGVIDTQKLIEQDAVGSSVPEIIARALAGDVSVVRNDGFYGDITQMPSTYAEILNTVNAAHRAFDELDVDIKSKFSFNFEQWFATINTEDWLGKMNMLPQSVVEEKKEVEE